MSAVDENDSDIKLAVSCIGNDARPTGRIRMLASASTGRFQQQWRGSLGSIWIDVPKIEVDVMPPETF